MKRYGENFELTEEVLDTIASYMDDDKREHVHFDELNTIKTVTEPERLLRQKLILERR